MFQRSNCKPHLLLYNYRIVSYQEISNEDNTSGNVVKAKELGYEPDDE